MPDGTGVEVDVGVVTWNTSELTVAALRHLLDGDQGCRFRLLVRDNASSDGTVDALRAEVPEAEIDAGDRNLGFAAGMNTLIARSSAPWFFALNSDAWPEPGAIGRLVAVGAARPRAAAIAPRLLRPDGTLEFSTYPFPSVGIAAAAASSIWRWRGPDTASRLLLEGFWRHDEARDVDWAVGAALLMRRTALEQVGGFDERFFMYAEDLEWCWRASRRGWSIRFDPDAVVRHVGNASGASAYGRRRTAAHLGNAYRFYRDEHGAVSTAAWQALNLIGTTKLYVGARRRGDDEAAHRRADEIRAHLRAHRALPRPTSCGR